MKQCRIIVTGGSGVLGQHLLAQLQNRPDTQVLAIHRPEMPHLLAGTNIRHVAIDFSDHSTLARLFDDFQPTNILHCAASGMLFPLGRWFDLIRFNVDFTLSLFELTSRYSGCHFIYLSTGLAYRCTGKSLSEMDALDNMHPYGASKGASDLLLRSASIEFGVPLTIFRPFSFTGRGDDKTRLFPSLLKAAEEGKPLRLSACDQIRDFCSAKDIARAVIMALDSIPGTKNPMIFNVGSGRAVPLKQLICQIVEELAIPVQLNFGSRPYTPFEPIHLVSDNSKIALQLGWRPQHNLAHAVWQLAAASFPSLNLREPSESIHDQ